MSETFRALLVTKTDDGQKSEIVDFNEADLSGCDFTDVEFEKCYLNGAVFSDETKLDGADLRGAFISETSLGMASMRGAVMTTAQARYLLFEKYGIVVAEEE